MGAVKRRVVGLGLCVVDQLFRVERLDLEHPRTRWLERRTATGGMACNATLQAASLGCRAELLSVIGDDSEGRFLRRELRRGGVGTRRLVVSRELPTTVAVVLVAERGGERRFIVPDRRGLERSAPELDLGGIDARCVLLVDGHFPQQALRAVRRARRLGATVVGDFSRPRPALLALLPYVDFPIVPEEFALAYGDGDPRRALRRLRDRFGGAPVVTLGARGGLSLNAGRLRRYRARRVAVRDTTGAGDAFHGAFAAGLAHGLAFDACIDLAARAAARCCRTLGGAADPLRSEEVAALRRRLS